ncbi:MAG: hypothetical protein IJ171_05265, partial [Ruminococcus sp.]|nr:hypothetical protein [Ruminococcus sp.]
FLEKLERLPELNKEELTELSDKVKEFNKNKCGHTQSNGAPKKKRTLRGAFPICAMERGISRSLP